MRLLSLELENFRQFEGRQSVEFATGGDQGNVTLVYGANGAGKTTLLNAFTWVLYEELSKDVEEPERLITDGVWERSALGQTVSCSVTLMFEHHGDQYALRRSVSGRKDGARQQLSQSTVSLSRTGADGAWQEIDSYSDSVDQIMPGLLSRFFFFNGERIEQLVQRDAYKDIQAAVKTLLGLEQYGRALDHLPRVEKIFSAELRRLGKSRASDLVELREQEEVEHARLEDERSALISEIGHLNDEIDVREQELRRHAAAKPLQARRDEQRSALEEASRRLEGARRDRVKILTHSAYKIWLADLLPRVEEMASALQARGELPAPLKRQFVDERLESGECICGTALRPGEDPYRHVEEWRQKAGLAEVEGVWQQMKGDTKRADELREGSIAELRRVNGEIASADEAQRRAVERLNEIAGQLRQLGDKDVQQLERRLGECRDKVRTHELRLHELKNDVAAVSERIKNLTDKLKKAKGEDEKVDLLRRRITLTSEATKVIKEMLGTASESVRRRLDSRLRSMLSEITIKPFIPELSESFELRLWFGEGPDRLPAPKSTGENQILSLAFVGALVRLCRDQAEQGEAAQLVGRVGGEYPIVMDAAFGHLDDSYREAIARALPRMASQVVVLSSKAQADGVVSKELAPHAAAEYVIGVHTTKPDVRPELITLRGRDYDYVVPSARHDHAILRRVD